MENQRFIPEGWNTNDVILTKEKLINAMQEDLIMQGRVISCDNNYNLHLETSDGINAIIPREEVEAIYIDSLGYPKPNICANKVNKLVQFRVNEFTENNTVILSRKKVGLQAVNWLKNELKPGDVVKGIVTNIRPFGAFVEIGGGVSGLLHIEDISVARIKNPNERFKIGQKINVMVKLVDPVNNRIELTYKELLGTWKENIEDLKEGTVVTGIVRNKEKLGRGIFIEIKPNLVGLAEPEDGIEYGQRVNVFVKRIIPEKKKIKLVLLK